MEYVLLDYPLISVYSVPVVCAYGKLLKWKASWQNIGIETKITGLGIKNH